MARIPPIIKELTYQKAFYFSIDVSSAASTRNRSATKSNTRFLSSNETFQFHRMFISSVTLLTDHAPLSSGMKMMSTLRSLPFFPKSFLRATHTAPTWSLPSFTNRTSTQFSFLLIFSSFNLINPITAYLYYHTKRFRCFNIMYTYV
jgi:hypothetical protein